MNKKLLVGGGLGVLGAIATFAGMVLTNGFTIDALIPAVIAVAGSLAVITKARKGQ